MSMKGNKITVICAFFFFLNLVTFLDEERHFRVKLRLQLGFF